MRRRRRRKRAIGILGVLAFVIVIAGVFLAVMLHRYYAEGKERANLTDWFGLTDSSQTAVIVDGTVIDGTALLEDGVVYLPYNVVQGYINDRFYFDQNNGVLLYCMPTELIRTDTSSTDPAVSGNGGLVMLERNDTVYLALPFIQEYTGLTAALYENPGRIVITKTFGTKKVCSVKKDTVVREKGGIKSPILSDVKSGTEVTVVDVEETVENWTKVRTEDGFTGYIRNRYLSDATEKTVESGFVEPEYTSMQKDYPICMGWLQVTSDYANTIIGDSFTSNPTLTTIAPTWLYAMDTSGNITSITSDSVVQTAHSAGKEVWVTVNDFDAASLFGGIGTSEETLALLSNTQSRQNLVSQIVGAVLSCGADGINVDFEKVSEDCGEHYIEFIRELSIECRNNGLVLSVDSYVPSSWTQQYHRDEQAVFADYVVIMAYDENGSWSTEKGPNSSMSYVSDAISDTLQSVPANKMILALPLYDKLWEEDPVAGTNTVTASCTTQTMDAINTLLAAHGVTPALDSDSGQNFACYEENGSYFSVWLDDAYSIDQKLSLMQENNLAGVSFWKLGQETSDIWDVVAKYFQ